ncbi:uncharacterized protein LOC107016567 [Solanum pennellii]|uniref:Uncharacterized protein LOC107016567 n=1 Tax=Solanum pennellii TaxID=28526 RepID=A0ABM1GKT9_SOLPN|nr:uncharacterized protein LOC107016567 [Solanum pennellii]
MGHLDHSADVRATKLEASVRWMNEADILAALNPVRASIHDFDARFSTCERRCGETSEVTTLKAEVEDLRKDVDYLKSTDFTSLLEADYDVDAHEIPSATTGYVHRVDTIVYETDADTNEKQIEVKEDNIDGDLPDLEETILQ